jgi:hypothetical protein
MNFEGDAFISYAHLDNVELIEGHKGWVASLHRALETRVAQLHGEEARIWWDPKLQGNDYFADALVERLQRVKALVAVVTPRYVKSEWGRRELVEFCKAATEQGGIRVKDKARIFKVLKTPVERELHPPELQSLLGYEFFKVDPDTGRVRELALDEVFGADVQKDFCLKLDDLAHDICALLDILPAPGLPPAADPAPSAGAVYLAVTTSELEDQREAIKRDLAQHGFMVFPDRPLPLAASAMQAAVREDLASCRMSIHMVGKTYSMVPEGGRESLVELQNELAIERAASGQFSRLVWIPPGVQVEDERQRKVLEGLRMDPRIEQGADLLETPLDDLRTMIDRWLKKGDKPDKPGREAAVAPQVYLIYDQRDAGSISPWADLLFKDFEVIHPVFDGDEAETRAYHQENLQSCDGALIFYGAANECWLRGKLGELKKSVGYRQTKVKPIVGICLIAPRTAAKERLLTHEAVLMPQWEGLSPDGLQPFVSRLKPNGAARQGDGTAIQP